MPDEREQQLLSILRIGHETSVRGSGISLREALNRCKYKQVRSTFGPQDLLLFIRSNPAYVREWLMYSEDKRTSGGWWILENGEIGLGSDRSQIRRFDTMDEAVANYVVCELDYWAKPSS